MNAENHDEMIEKMLLVVEERIGLERALRAQDTIQIQLKNSIWRKMRNGEKLDSHENAILNRVLHKVLGRDTMQVLSETARMFTEEA